MTERTVARGLIVLIACDLTLVVLHLLVTRGDPPGQLATAMFGLDREANLPTWFSSTKLLLVGCCFLWASAASEPSTTPRQWLSLAGLAFIFLSADEAASIHESITYVLRPIEWLPRFHGGHGIWIPLYGVIALLGLLAGRPLLHWLRMERARALGFLVVGASLFGLGAVGLEIASYGDLRDPALRGLYLLQVALEEGLELVGASVLLAGAALLLTEAGEEPLSLGSRPVQSLAGTPAERGV